MKKINFIYVLILAMVTMLAFSCTPYRKVVTTPVVPEITIVEKEVIVIEPETVVQIKENIMFDYDSSVIDTIQMDKVDIIVGLMKLYPDTLIVLKGYASSEGDFEYNVKLSLARAVSVKTELMNQNIEEERIDIIGIGATSLFGELLDLNRRVLILNISE